MPRKPTASRLAAKASVSSSPRASLLLDTCSALHSGGPRGSRPQWVAPMARPFGRRASCPSPPLAIDESAGLSASGRRIRRSRQVNSADASPQWGARGRHSLRPSAASDPRRRRPEGWCAAGPRVEWQARAGHGPRGRLRLEWPDLRQPVPDRQGDDRNELERSSLLRSSTGEDRVRRTKQANAERGGQGSQRPPRRMQRREMRREGSVGQGHPALRDLTPGSRPIRGSNRTSTPSTPNGRLPRPTSRVRRMRAGG